MNLFVVGPRSLADWILRMIEDTKDQLLELTPPIDLKVTSDIARVDAVIYEADQREDSTSDDAYGGCPRLCIVEPGTRILSAPNETLLFREAIESDPEWLKARFSEAMKTIFLQCHLHAFQRTLSGPFSHDIRGALSVVSLSRQLLESGGGGKLVSGKLSRVGSRIAMALSDMEARSLCLSGAWPPDAGTTQMGAPRIEEISAWFARTQGERKLETNDAVLDEIRRAPAWVTVALAGCIDGVTRLSLGDVRINTGNKGDDCSFTARVTGERAALDEDQSNSLRESERWPLISTHVMPYRLGTAALLVGAADGSVVASVEGENLIVEMRLP